MVQLGIIKEDKTMSDNINNTNPPSEPLTREEEYLSAIAGVTSSDDIPEKPLTRVEKYLNKIVEDGGGSVYDKLEAGTNINIEETSDGKAKISATGEVSSEDTYAREQIADHIADKDNPHEVSAADVGLGNCDNTSDLNKPISTATQTALNLKADKTEIPSVPITAIQKNGTGITPVSGTVNITVPTSAADVSALPDTTKYAAALSLTINSSTYVMTGQLKDQNGDNLGTAQTIDLPLESVVVGGSYNSQTKKVVLTLQNGNTIEFSVADLVSGLQTELSASNKLNPAYINYDSTHRAVSDTEKSTWNSKQNAIDSSHKLSADLVDDTSTTNKFATAEELEQISTNKNNISSLKSMGQYTMSGTTNPDTGNTTFAGLFKLALDDLGLSTSTLHHYIVYIYTNTLSPTAELLIMYGTFQYNITITHYVIHSSQIAYYVDNTQGTLAVSGGTAPVKATVRYLD